MFIDGLVLLTEVDEFCYHEMIAHIPLCMHKKAQKVLVIEGGDRETVRQTSKHDKVREVDACEIDEKITEISRRHFPYLANSLDDPKVKIFWEDGKKFIREKMNTIPVLLILLI